MDALWERWIRPYTGIIIISIKLFRFTKRRHTNQLPTPTSSENTVRPERWPEDLLSAVSMDVQGWWFSSEYSVRRGAIRTFYMG